ncbi:kinase [Sphingomonas oligophenolica]|uniref:Kinase n=2 Tax=Sphingomonas oligophenolica TaxID=301154 RepID=A0ABU9YB70_9SPHN
MNSDELTANIDAFMVTEALPTSFRAAIEHIYAPLADRIAAHVRQGSGPRVVGLCGPQGSGKSTGAEAIRLLLQAVGLRVAILSLDDLYLTRAERTRLASTTHPLLATRGPPGSHDLALGNELMDRLLTGPSTALPSFDKATDDRRSLEQGKVIDGRADIVLFEGWCVGARPELPEALAEPINDLERDLDPDGIWRGFVNAELARYQSLFSRIDFLIFLKPPGFEVVAGWRREQEAKLRDRSREERHDLRVMTDDEVTRFVQYYERLTRHIIREMPDRADAVVELGTERDLRRLVFAQVRSAL